MTKDEFEVRYRELSHAMQTGVAHEMEIEGRKKATEPKHLRVGVNSALCAHGALVKLLVDKGVITESEYFDSMILALEDEVEDYEARLFEHYGGKVTLR